MRAIISPQTTLYVLSATITTIANSVGRVETVVQTSVEVLMLWLRCTQSTFLPVALCVHYMLTLMTLPAARSSCHVLIAAVNVTNALKKQTRGMSKKWVRSNTQSI